MNNHKPSHDTGRRSATGAGQISGIALRLPPRREPRILAVVLTRRTLAYAVLDPFEVRAIREVPRPVGKDSLDKLLRSILIREKPTAVVLPESVPRALAPLHRLVQARGLGFAQVRLHLDRAYEETAR